MTESNLSYPHGAKNVAEHCVQCCSCKLLQKDFFFEGGEKVLLLNEDRNKLL